VLDRLGRSTAAVGFGRTQAHGLADDLADGSYLVHALVARAARFHFPAGYLNRLWMHASELIGAALEANRGRFDRTRTSAPYLPHVLPLVTTPEWSSGRTQWHMLNEAGRSEYELGATEVALDFFEVLHEVVERSDEADDETRLNVRTNLGAAHFGQGNLRRAYELQLETVRRLERSRGPAHPDTLQAKESLANTLNGLGQHDEARRSFTQVYRARRDARGKTDRPTLITLNNLVIAVRRCGEFRLALRLALGAWALWQRAAGPDAPETLECVENIGNNLLFLGQWDQSAATQEYVAVRRRIVLGPDHPDTIDAEENVATANGLTYWPAYAARLRTQGPTHPDTLVTLRRLLLASLKSSSGTPASPAEPAGVQADGVRLDGEHADLLVEIVELAAAFADQEAAHGPADPRALRAKVLLAHALAAADQIDGQVDDALIIVVDSRDGLEEAAARTPDRVRSYDLAVAESIHHWILELRNEDPTY
jgi:hypothetical protein